ncbi:MAG: aldo/keto reductase [Candidatus Poribacteria bacterium]|nr:aldo/keto reductase [Candidatus Poribacteria bacterium]MDE0502726.1 aldo/keto reductase [Candidatus Poribacteria bacterium]
MEFKSLGCAGVKVSRICLGAMMFGGPTDESDSIRIIHRALDAGVNFIDTANVYNGGESERIVGKAVHTVRDEVVIATKVCGPMADGPNQSGSSRYHIMHEVEESLRRLGTDRIDLYYLHRPDPTTPIEESLRALDDCVKQGKVRYIACSNFHAWRVCEGLSVSEQMNLERFACVQPLYNIVNRDIEVELLPLCREHGIGVVPYSPLARGVLSGKYRQGKSPPEGSRAARRDGRLLQTELREESYEVARQLVPLAEAHNKTLTQFALAWVLANPIVTSVIIGPRTIQQVDDNLGCLDCVLSDPDEEVIDQLVPRGEHTGKGYADPAYPVLGRPNRE